MNAAMYRFLDLAEAAEFYAVTMEFAASARRRLPLEWCEVRYESLVRDLPGQSREICRFLKLAWLPDLERFAERAASSNRATPSTAQLARGLDPARAAAPWLDYAAALEAVQPILAPWVERLGYARPP
jgi:hypothetical protein